MSDMARSPCPQPEFLDVNHDTDLEKSLGEESPLLKRAFLQNSSKAPLKSEKETTALSRRVSENGAIRAWAPRLLLQVAPFSLLAGIGLVCTGVVLDTVQKWGVFVQYEILFILVPALLGLKGNLEMTLATRLSTYQTMGYLEGKKATTLIVANLALVQVQALAVAFLASIYAAGVSLLMHEKVTMRELAVVMSSSLTAACGSSGVLSSVMSAIVLLAPRCGIDPDNISTPIAATLGDFITLGMLAMCATSVHNHVDAYPALPWVIVGVFLLSVPFWLYVATRHDAPKLVLRRGWVPIILAMLISSAGGVVLQRFVDRFPNLSLFDPVLNGVGGNIAAVHAARMSTSLHLADLSSQDSVPRQAIQSSHKKSGALLWGMGTLMHVVFLFAIVTVHHTLSDLTLKFSAIYLLAGSFQIFLLLVSAQKLVFWVWDRDGEPDDVAIPYVTAFGDLLGTSLLAIGFFVDSFL